MNDPADNFEPTPEYLARLDSEVMRAFRSEQRFGPSPAPSRARRLIVGFSILAGVALTLLSGMVLGASAGYASAAIPDAPRPSLAMIPIKTINALRCPSPLATPPVVTSSASRPDAVIALPPAQRMGPTIPIRPLRVVAETSDTVASIYGIVELSSGRVLLSDGARRRILMFGPNLDAPKIVVGSDKVPYPRSISSHLIPARGDTTLFPDFDSQAFVQITPEGGIGRIFAAPKASDLANIAPALAPVGLDARGRLIYPAAPKRRMFSDSMKTGPWTFRDTTTVLAADFESRNVDTVGYVSYPVNSPMQKNGESDGKPAHRLHVNPAPRAPDQWVVTSDGVVAVVRVDDYHIDWTYPDGRKVSTGKMPMDWRRLTDDDKKALVDSVQHVMDDRAKEGRPYGMTVRPRPMEGMMMRDTIIPTIEFVPFSEMPDYYPAVRLGGVAADLDGRVWILPFTSLSAKGGLLYDVVDVSGKIVERVQLPGGRALAGFGRGGVVYLRSVNQQTGVKVEKTVIQR